MLESLGKEELLDLIMCYDKYIQDANEGNCYVDGWCPVCVEEFYQNDYKVWIEDGLWQKLN